MEQRSSSGFGRGWVPMERDIGLPNDVWPESPLPPAGGAGGGRVGSTAAFDAEHALPPTPSRWREGEPRLSLPFTTERQVRFLHHLAQSGHVRRACARVGVSAQAAYVCKRRDLAFARGWDAALVLARDAAEEVLAERALNGTRETIFYRGEAVGSRVRFDTRLLLAHLARLDKHHAEAHAAGLGVGPIAARFDDYLGEMLDGGPGFAAPDEDALTEAAHSDLVWSPANPSRAEALAEAREQAVYGFPETLADCPPEALAGLDTENLEDEDVWPEAVAAVQDHAEQAAAEAWDAEAAARHAALDAVCGDGLCGDTPPSALRASTSPFAPSTSSGENGEELPDPPGFGLSLSKAQTGRGTAPAGGGGGVNPEPAREKGASPSGEAPLETKAFFAPLNRVNRVNRARGCAAGLPPQSTKSSAVSAPSSAVTMKVSEWPALSSTSETE